MWPFSKRSIQKPGEDDQDGGRSLRYDQVREAENKRYLTELVNARRPPEIQKRLLEVLKYEPSLTKKIDIVERLDRLGVDTLGWYEQRITLVKAGAQRAQTEKARKSAYFFQSPEYRALSVESKELLRGLEPPSFFRFATREFRKISAYGRRTGLLKASLFPLRHELAGSLLTWCNDEMRMYAAALEHSLARVVERGWATLDIHSYNLLVRFEALVRGWLAESPRLLHKNTSRLVWLKLGPLARIWFSITRVEGQASLALDGLAQFLKANGADGAQIRRQLSAAEAILDAERVGVSFGRAVLAVWMLLSRRFFTLPALMEKLKPEPVSRETWVCPTETLEMIQAFIQARRSERDEFSRTILLLDEIGILEPDLMDERCMHEIWCLYAEALHVLPEAGRTAASQARQTLAVDITALFERATSNLSYCITILMRDRLLAEHTLAGERDLLDRALSAMRSIRQVRERLVIPMATYDAWVRKNTAPEDLSDAERGFAQAIADAGAAAAHIGLKVQQLVTQAAGLDYLAGAKARDASGILADLSEDLREPQVFAGVSLRESLARVQAWGIALAWFAGDATIRGLVKRRGDVAVDLASVEATLARMEGESASG
ncbi:MAG TPA: hypothetical protein PK297_03700 [Spirochaetota bacterium]|nr:hypothetical protein [Spirochaetota bacterium]